MAQNGTEQEERRMEKTKSQFFEPQDPGEGWGHAYLGSLVWGSAQLLLGMERVGAEGEQRACLASASHSCSWRCCILERSQILLWADPVSKACVFSFCPLHTWCGLGTQVSEAFQLQNRLLQKLWAAHFCKSLGMLAASGHWREVRVEEACLYLINICRVPNVCWIQSWETPEVLCPLIPFGKRHRGCFRWRNWGLEEVTTFLKGCSRWLQSWASLLSDSHHRLPHWAAQAEGLPFLRWLPPAMWLEQVMGPLQVSVSSDVQVLYLLLRVVRKRGVLLYGVPGTVLGVELYAWFLSSLCFKDDVVFVKLTE